MSTSLANLLRSEIELPLQGIDLGIAFRPSARRRHDSERAAGAHSGGAAFHEVIPGHRRYSTFHS
jgi:hypothetical protein